MFERHVPSAGLSDDIRQEACQRLKHLSLAQFDHLVGDVELLAVDERLPYDFLKWHRPHRRAIHRNRRAVRAFDGPVQFRDAGERIAVHFEGGERPEAHRLAKLRARRSRRVLRRVKRHGG